MEESMCWEMNYKFLAEERKAQEIKRQRRADLIDQLLNDTNQQGQETKAEGTPPKEIAPAK
jgi:hypothetical protein